MREPLKVSVTGSTGDIAYPFIFELASGRAFGVDQPLELTLYDVRTRTRMLQGVALEVEECAFPLVRSVATTDDLATCFRGVQLAVLIGSVARRPGLSEADYLAANAKIFRQQGEALDRHAARDVRVLVVGNPCTANAWVCARHAPSLPATQFAAMARNDQFRAECQIAGRLGVPRPHLRNVAIWGNHSASQFADASRATVFLDGRDMPVSEALKDDVWLRTTFVENNQSIKVRERGSIASSLMVALNICLQLRDWFLGTPPGCFTSMCVASDGSYGVPLGIMFSFPITIENKQWKIVQEWELDDLAKQWLKSSEREILRQMEIIVNNIDKD